MSAATGASATDPSAEAEQPDLDLSRAPLLAHLVELRRRSIHTLLFFVVAFALSYGFSESLYAFLAEPLYERLGESSGRRMIYTSLHEVFFTYLKLSAFAALFLTLPFMMMQGWRFLAPGLYEKERSDISPLVWATPLLFFLGAALAYTVVIPMAWSFFLSFETNTATSMPIELEARVSEYLGLVMKLVIAFGLAFELPVVLLVLARLGLIDAADLRSHRKHAIVLTFLVAAFLTPPDIISQLMLGTPVLLLYEISIRVIERTVRPSPTRAARRDIARS